MSAQTTNLESEKNLNDKAFVNRTKSLVLNNDSAKINGNSSRTRPGSSYSTNRDADGLSNINFINLENTLEGENRVGGGVPVHEETRYSYSLTSQPRENSFSLVVRDNSDGLIRSSNNIILNRQTGLLSSDSVLPERRGVGVNSDDNNNNSSNLRPRNRQYHVNNNLFGEDIGSSTSRSSNNKISGRVIKTEESQEIGRPRTEEESEGEDCENFNLIPLINRPMAASSSRELDHPVNVSNSNFREGIIENGNEGRESHRGSGNGGNRRRSVGNGNGIQPVNSATNILPRITARESTSPFTLNISEFGNNLTSNNRTGNVNNGNNNITSIDNENRAAFSAATSDHVNNNDVTIENGSNGGNGRNNNSGDTPAALFNSSTLAANDRHPRVSNREIMSRPHVIYQRNPRVVKALLLVNSWMHPICPGQSCCSLRSLFCVRCTIADYFTAYSNPYDDYCVYCQTRPRQLLAFIIMCDIFSLGMPCGPLYHGLGTASFGCWTRWIIRRKYGIVGFGWKDAVAALLFPGCVVDQMVREVEENPTMVPRRAFNGNGIANNSNVVLPSPLDIEMN